MKIQENKLKEFLKDYSLTIEDFNDILNYYSMNSTDRNLKVNVFNLCYGLISQVLDFENLERNKINYSQVLKELKSDVF